MKQAYRRPARRGGGPARRRSPFQQILRSIVVFFRRLKRAFFALRPGGRIAALGVCATVVVGLGLLVVLPVGKDSQQESIPPLPEPVEMRGGISTMSAAEPGDVMGLTVPTTPEPTATPLPTPTPDPTLKQGVPDSEEVTKLQSRLMDLGYLDIDEPTQHFGPATKYAVQLFQRQHDLEKDGIAGPKTLEMIFQPDAKKYTMLEDFSGNDVENFQQQLKDLGYLKTVDGHYGSATIAAVKAFQKENRLSADGKAGEQTLELINSDKAKPSPEKAAEKRRSANIDTMIATAKKQLGKKYVLGKTGPDSFDCSGLVYYCLKAAGSNRRRLNAAGYSSTSDWEKISRDKLKKGDLLFFYNNAKTKVGHVGIYIGGGEMIDASSSNGKVVRRSISSNYWKTHWVCARRPW